MRYATLCSGIEGFGKGFERAGMECVFQCENDKDCNRVLEHHWPTVPRTKDVNDEQTRSELVRLRPDVVAFGSPCQDLSVAGRRGGLAGQRSGLFFRCVELCKAAQPRFIVFENVPGLLSSNDGKDFAVVLDSFNDAGYIADVEILDAQFFGLAQRRRRVFIVCENAAIGLTKKSEFFLRAISLAVMQTLHANLIGSVDLLAAWPSGSAAKDSRDGLRKKMKFFDNLPFPNLMRTLPSVLLEAAAKSLSDCTYSESTSKSEPVESLTETKKENFGAATGFFDGLTRQGFDELSLNTSSSWSGILDGILKKEKRSITLTASQQTIESRIFSSAEVALTISKCIAAWKSSCPYWSAVVSYSSTVLQEFMRYARQATESLFEPVEWRTKYGEFLESARQSGIVVGDIGDDCGTEILSLAESGSGHPPPRRQAEPRIAAALRSRSSSAGVSMPGRGGEDDVNIVAEAARPQSTGANGADNLVSHSLTACRTASGRLDPNGETFIAGTLQASNGGMSDSNRVGELVAQHYNGDEVASPITAGYHKGTGVNDGKKGSPQNLILTGALNSGGNDGGFRTEPVEHLVTHALRSEGADASEDDTGRGTPLAVIPYQQAAAGAMGVRRLLPVECLRLQGFDDTNLDLDPPLSDSAKYRMIGNACAVPVCEWIGRRIILAKAGDVSARQEA